MHLRLKSYDIVMTYLGLTYGNPTPIRCYGILSVWLPLVIFRLP